MIKFTQNFSIELSPEEADVVVKLLDETPAKFSRSLLNKLERIAEVQSEMTPKKLEGMDQR